MVAFEQIEDFDEVVRQLDAVVPVYGEVYAEAPYDEGPQDAVDFLTRARRQAARDGFRLVLARASGEIAGFSYGFWLPADTGWWSAVRAPLGDAFVEETGRRTFNLAELAVRRGWRRQGIAAELHRRLIAGLEAERIALTMRPEPEAAPAQAAYGAWGYRNVGRAQYGDASPAYDVMVLPLR
ncbi:GNAT family N-acetyltransferase [Streptomyces sp. MB09-01]|uniref:GNAT family N-acetyltransferase n=1 Tax=Streptomyces sp. MB09-01 TaxID=3028666 RepID=UPI0029C9BC2B|nr:GNAT family N-acetyltransferase [Streptomyces sp. MB09-01]